MNLVWSAIGGYRFGSLAEIATVYGIAGFEP